jgi:exopolysaccharide production protein ExoZ
VSIDASLLQRKDSMESPIMRKTLKTFASLQAGRAIAALMVVLYHCYIILELPKYWNHSWKKYLLCGHSGVEFFFVLSGIVILNAHWADRGHPEALKSYAWKRFRRIYPIYWLVLAAVLPIYYLIPTFGTGVERQPAVILSSFALVHIVNDSTVLPVAWTLYHEMMFYVVFAFIIVRRVPGLVLLGVWMSFSVYALVSPIANPLWSAYTSPLHLLFGFGMVVMLIVRGAKVPAPHVFLFLGAAGFIASCVHENLTAGAFPMAPICYGFTAALCALGLMELESSRRITVPQALSFLGDASYSIYLVHFPALSIMAKIIYPLWLRMKVPLILPFVLLAAGSVAVGVLVHLFVERPLLKVLRTRKSASNARVIVAESFRSDAASIAS